MSTSFPIKPIFSRSKFTFSDNIYESAKDTDAILILTEWDEYKNIDWQIISKEMRKKV